MTVAVAYASERYTVEIIAEYTLVRITYTDDGVTMLPFEHTVCACKVANVADRVNQALVALRQRERRRNPDFCDWVTLLLPKERVFLSW